MKKICMIVQDPMVKGGIAAVVNGYYGSKLEEEYDVTYVQSYCDGNKWQKLWKAIKAYFRFAKILIANKPDIIHMHTSFGASFYRQIPFIYMSCFRSIPVVNHIHGPEFDKFFEQASRKKRALIRKIYNKCDALITLSEEWKTNFLQVVPEEKIYVIENYSVIAENIDISQRNYKQVLFLGAINKRKGCYDIPSVVKRVVSEVPEARFVIAGDGELDEMKKLLKSDNVEKYCVFPGWVRDCQKEKYLRESGLFYLPSYNEGMPMAILDAMGYGMPIVSTDVGGIPKIVHNDFNGYTCSPGDTDSMSEKILFLLKNEVKCKMMGENSIKVIKKNYTLDKHFEKLFELYEKVFQDKD